jgi:hypothetical protein
VGAAHLSSGEIIAELTLRSRVDNAPITQPMSFHLGVTRSTLTDPMSKGTSQLQVGRSRGWTRAGRDASRLPAPPSASLDSWSACLLGLVNGGLNPQPPRRTPWSQSQVPAGRLLVLEFDADPDLKFNFPPSPVIPSLLAITF